MKKLMSIAAMICSLAVFGSLVTADVAAATETVVTEKDSGAEQDQPKQKPAKKKTKKKRGPSFGRLEGY